MVRWQQIEEDVRKRILEQAVQQGFPKGVEPIGVMVGDTSSCPGDCNEKKVGGKCLCQEKDGECPGGSRSIGTGDGWCRADPTRFSVMGPNRDTFQVIMP